MAVRRRLDKLRVSVFAPILPGALYLFGGFYLFLLTALSVALHELGHCAALRRCGGRVDYVTLEATGVSMTHVGVLSYGGEVLTALAGPMMSLAAAVLSAFLGRVTDFAPLYHFSGLNIIFCVFNLLPVYPLDGGRALRFAAAYTFGQCTADRVSAISSAVCVLAALAGGVYVFVSPTRNVTLLAAAIALCASVRRR
jgi:Zn-dependent protease